MPSSTHFTREAQLRCFVTYPTFPSQVELVQVLSLHLSHCIFMVFSFSSLPPVSELFKGKGVSCESIYILGAWHMAQPVPTPCLPQRKALCLMETPELRQRGYPEAHHQRRGIPLSLLCCFLSLPGTDFSVLCVCVFPRCPGIPCKIKAAWVFSSLSRIIQCLPWNCWISP